MRIPDTTLHPWLEKLRDTRLNRRESWRIHGDSTLPPLRARNPVTDEFHYSAFGLLLRTDKGKALGRFHEMDFPRDVSYFIFRGISYQCYEGYEPTTKKPLPHYCSIGPRQLVKLFGFYFMDVKEWNAFDFQLTGMTGKNLTFEETADLLQYGRQKKAVVTHSNPLFAF